MATDQRRSAHTSVSSKTTLVGSSKEAAAIPPQQVPELPGPAPPHPPEVTSADGSLGAVPERPTFQSSRLKTSRAYHLIDQLQRRAAETTDAARAASEKARREVRAANTVKPRVASVVGLGSRAGGTSVGSVLSASKQSDRGAGSAVSKEGGNVSSIDGGTVGRQKNTGTGFQDHPFFAKKSPRGTAGEPEMSREEEEALFTASGARAGADGKGRFDRSDRRTATRDLQRSGSPRPRATRAHPKVALQRGLASRMELDGEEANVLWMGSLRGSDIPMEEGSRAAKALQRAASARGEGSAKISHKKTMGGVSIREEMGRTRTVSAAGKSRSAAPNMGFLVSPRDAFEDGTKDGDLAGANKKKNTATAAAKAVVAGGSSASSPSEAQKTVSNSKKTTGSRGSGSKTSSHEATAAHPQQQVQSDSGQRKVQQPEDECLPAGGLSPSNFTDLVPAGAVVLRGDILKKGKENVHGANKKPGDQEQTVAKKAPAKSANSTAAKVHTSGALTTRARVFSPRKQSPEASAKSLVEPASLARSSPGKKNMVKAVTGGSKAKPRTGSGEKKSGAQPKTAVAGTGAAKLPTAAAATPSADGNLSTTTNDDEQQLLCANSTNPDSRQAAVNVNLKAATAASTTTKKATPAERSSTAGNSKSLNSRSRNLLEKIAAASSGSVREMELSGMRSDEQKDELASSMGRATTSLEVAAPAAVVKVAPPAPVEVVPPAYREKSILASPPRARRELMVNPVVSGAGATALASVGSPQDLLRSPSPQTAAGRGGHGGYNMQNEYVRAQPEVSSPRRLNILHPPSLMQLIPPGTQYQQPQFSTRLAGAGDSPYSQRRSPVGLESTTRTASFQQAPEVLETRQRASQGTIGVVQSLSQWPQDVMLAEPVQSPPPELTGVPQYVNVPSLAEFLEPVSVEKPEVFGDEEVGHAASKEILASQNAAAEDVGNDVHVAVEVEQMRLPDAALQRSSAGSRFSDATEARIRKARQQAKARQAAASDRLSTRTERRNRRSGGAQMEDSMRQLEQNVRQVIATLDVVSTNSSRKEDQPSDQSSVAAVPVPARGVVVPIDKKTSPVRSARSPLALRSARTHTEKATDAAAPPTTSSGKKNRAGGEAPGKKGSPQQAGGGPPSGKAVFAASSTPSAGLGGEQALRTEIAADDHSCASEVPTLEAAPSVSVLSANGGRDSSSIRRELGKNWANTLDIEPGHLNKHNTSEQHLPVASGLGVAPVAKTVVTTHKTLREVLSPRSKVASPKLVSHFRIATGAENDSLKQEVAEQGPFLFEHVATGVLDGEKMDGVVPGFGVEAPAGCVEKHPHPLFVTSKIESPRWSSYSPVLFANESGLMEQKLEAYRASTNSLVYGSSNMAGQRDGAGGKSPKVAAREKQGPPREQVTLSDDHEHLAHHVIPRPPTATRSKRARSPGADNSSSGKKKKKSKNAVTPLESLETGAFHNKNQSQTGQNKHGQVSNPDESVRSARSRSASSYHESRLSPGEANDSADDVSLLREIEAVLHYNKSRIEEIIVHQTAVGSGGSAQGGEDAGGDGREGGTARSRKGSDQEVAWHLSPEGKVVMSSRKSSKHSKGASVEDHEATNKVVPAAGRADLASTSDHSLAVPRKNTTAPAAIAAAPPLEKKLSQAALQGAEIMPLAPVQSAIARSGFAASQAVSGSELDQEIVARALSSASKEPQSGPDAQAHLDEQKEIALQALRSIRATLSTRGMSTSNFGSANDNSVNCSVESPLVSIPSTGAHQPHYHPNAGGPSHHLSSSGIYLQRASTMPTGGAAPFVARGVANPNPASCAIAEENDDDTLTDDPDALRREFSKRLELHSNLIKSLRHSLGVNEADSVSAEETPKVGMTPREQQPAVLQRGDRPILIPASPRFNAVEGGGEGAAVGTESGGGFAAGGSNNNEGRAGTAGAAPVRLISAGGTVSYVGFSHPGRILGPEDRCSPRTSPRGGTTSPRQGAVKIVEQRGASAAVPQKDETSNSNKCQIRFDSSVPHDDAEDAGVIFLSASATNEDSMFLHTAKEQHTSASNSASAEKNFLFYEVPDRMAYIEERVERYLKGEDISPKRPWLLTEDVEGDAAGRVEAVVGAPLVQHQLQQDEEHEHDVNDVNKLTSPRRVQPRPENSPGSVQHGGGAREVENVARLFADEIAPPQRLSGAAAVVGTEEMQLRGNGNGLTALEAPKTITIGESAAVGDGAGDESPLDVAFIAEGEQFSAACIQPQETRLVHVPAFPSGQQSLSQYAAPGGREPQYAQAVNGQYESVPDSPSIPSCGPSETILSALNKIKTENLRGSSTIAMITAQHLHQQATSRYSAPLNSPPLSKTSLGGVEAIGAAAAAVAATGSRFKDVNLPVLFSPRDAATLPPAGVQPQPAAVRAMLSPRVISGPLLRDQNFSPARVPAPALRTHVAALVSPTLACRPVTQKAATLIADAQASQKNSPKDHVAGAVTQEEAPGAGSASSQPQQGSKMLSASQLLQLQKSWGTPVPAKSALPPPAAVAAPVAELDPRTTSAAAACSRVGKAVTAATSVIQERMRNSPLGSARDVMEQCLSPRRGGGNGSEAGLGGGVDLLSGMLSPAAAGTSFRSGGLSPPRKLDFNGITDLSSSPRVGAVGGARSPKAGAAPTIPSAVVSAVVPTSSSSSTTDTPRVTGPAQVSTVTGTKVLSSVPPVVMPPSGNLRSGNPTTTTTTSTRVIRVVRRVVPTPQQVLPVGGGGPTMRTIRATGRLAPVPEATEQEAEL